MSRSLVTGRMPFASLGTATIPLSPIAAQAATHPNSITGGGRPVNSITQRSDGTHVLGIAQWPCPGDRLPPCSPD